MLLNFYLLFFLGRRHILQLLASSLSLSKSSAEICTEADINLLFGQEKVSILEYLNINIHQSSWLVLFFNLKFWEDDA